MCWISCSRAAAQSHSTGVVERGSAERGIGKEVTAVIDIASCKSVVKTLEERLKLAA
jgi:hypothetical protein